MTVTIEPSSNEACRRTERSARLGQDLDAYLRRPIRLDLVAEPSGRPIAEILAPSTGTPAGAA